VFDQYRLEAICGPRMWGGIVVYLFLADLLGGGGTSEAAEDAPWEVGRGGPRAVVVAPVSPLTQGAGRKLFERREKRALGPFFTGETGAGRGRSVAGAADSSST